VCSFTVLAVAGAVVEIAGVILNSTELKLLKKQLGVAIGGQIEERGYVVLGGDPPRSHCGIG